MLSIRRNSVTIWQTGIWLDKVRPSVVWENVKTQVVQTLYGFLVFDDTVIDKNYSRKTALVRRQYIGLF
jgi:hypothetical protein